MTIKVRPDGSFALDWGPPRGPYITLTREQWYALLREIKRLRGA